MPTDNYRAIELLSRTPYGRVSASRRALPFTTVARHLVLDGRLVLRLHQGYDYHQALDGSVVAYEADNVNSGENDTWSVQFTGTARVVEPTPSSGSSSAARPCWPTASPSPRCSCASSRSS